MYCQINPSEKTIEVKSIVITIGADELVFDKDEAIELRDLLFDVFPKGSSSPWTYTVDDGNTIWTYPNTTLYHETT